LVKCILAGKGFREFMNICQVDRHIDISIPKMFFQ